VFYVVCSGDAPPSNKILVAFMNFVLCNYLST